MSSDTRAIAPAPTPRPSVPEAPAGPVVISAEGVGKRYDIGGGPLARLRQSLLGGSDPAGAFWALRGVSFEVRRGESVGIVGVNGSGKSTLLQIIAGTLAPSEGLVRVRGRIGALLELGSGFNPDFTGRDNVYLNGAILGFSRAQMDQRFDAIADFADIGAFIDQPVKTYSSGMMLRLAFAVQVQVEPDLLIVDEALAVGDSLFQKRCYQRLQELRDKGVTLLFVSHSQEAVRTLTTRAILLHKGGVRAIGEPGEVLLDYRRLLHEEERRWHDAHARRDVGAAAAAAENERPDDKSFGDLDARIESVEVLDADERPCGAFHPGDRMIIRVRYAVKRAMDRLNVGLRIRNKEGVKMYSWGTLNQDISIWAGRARGEVFWERTIEPGRTHRVDFLCDTPLGSNLYEVQAVVTRENDRYYHDQTTLHWRDEAAFFQVLLDRQTHFFGGVCDMRMRADAEQ